MRVRARKIGHKTYFYLRLSERAGTKVHQAETYLGSTLALPAERWGEVEISFRFAAKFFDGEHFRHFRKCTLPNILKTVERYVRRHSFPEDTLVGLREAVKRSAMAREADRKRRAAGAPTPAHTLLGVPVGANVAEITKAYRRLALTSHPDTGGDRQRFEELVKARDILLGKLTPTNWSATP
jgi:hypothetical protein